MNGSIDSDALLAELASRIEDRTSIIGVIGLGYVGLPLACAFATAGFQVVGIDRDEHRVDTIRRGISPIGGHEPGLTDLLEKAIHGKTLQATTDYVELSQASIITINVDTPIDSHRQPQYSSLIQACRSLAQVVQLGSLVIVESTVSPGTTLGLVAPLLAEGSGYDVGRELFLGACPERVMPGRLLANIRHVPRVCGGFSPEIAELMKNLYSSIVDASLDASDITTAELVKVTENTYRDVQIAFANEVAVICDDLGIDVWRVREFVNKVPFRDMHRPGGGVGGHCLPKDPWLLAAASDINLRLIPAARDVNDDMPHHVARTLHDRIQVWRSANVHDGTISIAVLGYSYLPDSDDVRNSPSIELISDLKSWGYEVRVHDPILSQYNHPLDKLLEGCVAAVVMVPHTAYDNLALDLPIVVKLGKRA